MTEWTTTQAHVVVTRHPDAENQFDVFGGPVKVIDIDLGSSFEGRPDDEEQARDWARSILADASDCPPQVRECVYNIVHGTLDGMIPDEELSRIARLEELRATLRAENMSYGELAELQGLAAFIDEGDVELLEAAGVPEYPDDNPLTRLDALLAEQHKLHHLGADHPDNVELQRKIDMLRNGIKPS